MSCVDLFSIWEAGFHIPGKHLSYSLYDIEIIPVCGTGSSQVASTNRANNMANSEVPNLVEVMNALRFFSILCPYSP